MDRNDNHCSPYKDVDDDRISPVHSREHANTTLSTDISQTLHASRAMTESHYNRSTFDAHSAEPALSKRLCSLENTNRLYKRVKISLAKGVDLEA